MAGKSKVGVSVEEEGDAAQAAEKPAAGEVGLYPVTVKTQSGENLELRLSPGDSVIDVKQFLLEAPETCFYTHYDLILHTKDGSAHRLEQYNKISEIADITIGGCSLEIVATYDETSIRSHLHRFRELLSFSSLRVSFSTSLARQAKNTDTGKTAVHELDGLNFMNDSTVALTSLLSPAPAEIKCVRSILFSSFNPPPSHRRLYGDLIYIDVVTLEGNKYCVTGSSESFYVNSSSGDILDPRPSKKSHEASTLVGLLLNISTNFKKGFSEILDRRTSRHPFENVQAMLPVTSWLGDYPVQDHKRDIARAEECAVFLYGTELIGSQRDWNEELQFGRELPRGNPQERILRGSSLCKVTCQFVDAAIKGAIGVINKSIRPINLTDPKCSHVYVHNNIAFSFAVDSDYEHILKGQNPDCQNDPGRSMPVPSIDLGAKADRDHADSSVALKSKTEEPNSALEASAEAEVANNDQMTYASANNDLNGTKAYQEADIPGLYNLGMAIIDYRGHRVVANSIIPGILQGDKSDSLLYGTVDNGKKISCNESFHAKVVEAAKRLHVKEHLVFDGSGNPVKLAATVECKGIVGSDDRHYILGQMRVTPRDSNFIGLQHRFCVLRPELVASFVEAESTKKSPVQKVPDIQSKDQHSGASDSTAQAASMDRDDKYGESPAPTPAESNNSIDEILFNPNVFTECKLAGSPEEIAADEALVKKVGSYLLDAVIPKFVQDLCSLDISPMDGQTLTDVLHSNGINVRYLGKVAIMIKHVPHLWDLFCAEIIVRSAKHVFKEILRQSTDRNIPPAVAHFLNCFAGKVLAASTKGSGGSTQSETPKAQKSSPSSRKVQSLYSDLTSDQVWSDIKEFARHKYQFVVPDDARVGAKKVAVLRNLCQKVGVLIAARKYKLDSAAPFQASDILDLQPIVKHSVPTCTDARKLMEAGKIRMAEGTLIEAYELFSEAFSLLELINGPIHKDAANCCWYLAKILYSSDDIAGAILQQRRELIINERCLGLDHPDTARSYHELASIYHSSDETETALQYMSRTMLLQSVASGPDRPDVVATLVDVAMMYQQISNFGNALRYLNEVLEKHKCIFGPDHIKTSDSYHGVAMAVSSMGLHSLSVKHQTDAHRILAKEFGTKDSRTVASKNCLEGFKKKEKQAKKKSK